MLRLRQVWRRVSEPGDEPPKPALKVTWPPALDESMPDVNSPMLPGNLTTQIADFERMRRAAESRGGEFALSSFVWLAYQGMRLQLPRQEGIWLFLNRGLWPFSYSHIRRYADFQNRVFASYARAHDEVFVDLARSFPQARAAAFRRTVNHRAGRYPRRSRRIWRRAGAAGEDVGD